MTSNKARGTESRRKENRPLLSKAGPSVSKRAKPTPESNHQGEKRQVTVRLRPALKKAIETEARSRELTVQALFLLGMRKLGLPVTADDLQDQRKSDGASVKRATGAARASDRRERGQGPLTHRSGPEQLIRLGLQALGEQSLSLAGGPTIIVVSSGYKYR